MANDDPAGPDTPDDSDGIEPEVESGAGYGNHAPTPDDEGDEDDRRDA